MSKFRVLCGQKLDISEHLGLLRGLACSRNVQSIVEIGFRGGVSATALATAGKPLTCFDIEPCEDARRELKALAPNFKFVQGDSLELEIPQCDLLHIDSLHTYTHLRQELKRHGNKSQKYICLHDTETFGGQGKDGLTPGLASAIVEFLDSEGGEWKVLLNIPNCNGMTVLARAWPEPSILQ